VAAAVAAWVTIGAITEPGGNVDRYNALHERYQSLYPALQPWFKAVGADPT
jgi:hypothetical protein